MTYQEKLVKEVKLTGQTLIDEAESIVGTEKNLVNFNIWIRFPTENAFIPEIEVDRTYYPPISKVCDIEEEYRKSRKNKEDG